MKQSSGKQNRIPISRDFVKAVMWLPLLNLKISSIFGIGDVEVEVKGPESELKYVLYDLENILISLARMEEAGTLINSTGKLHPYLAQEMQDSFGIYSIFFRKPSSLFVRDFRQEIRKNGPICCPWAIFDILPDGSVTWTAIKQPHDSGLPPPDQKVYVTLFPKS